LSSSRELSNRYPTSFVDMSEGFVEVAETRVSRSTVWSTSESEKMVMADRMDGVYKMLLAAPELLDARFVYCRAIHEFGRA